MKKKNFLIIFFNVRRIDSFRTRYRGPYLYDEIRYIEKIIEKIFLKIFFSGEYPEFGHHLLTICPP